MGSEGVQSGCGSSAGRAAWEEEKPEAGSSVGEEAFQKERREETTGRIPAMESRQLRPRLSHQACSVRSHHFLDLSLPACRLGGAGVREAQVDAARLLLTQARNITSASLYQSNKSLRPAWIQRS